MRLPSRMGILAMLGQWISAAREVVGTLTAKWRSGVRYWALKLATPFAKIARGARDEKHLEGGSTSTCTGRPFLMTSLSRTAHENP